MAVYTVQFTPSFLFDNSVYRSSHSITDSDFSSIAYRLMLDMRSFSFRLYLIFLLIE